MFEIVRSSDKYSCSKMLAQQKSVQKNFDLKDLQNQFKNLFKKENTKFLFRFVCTGVAINMKRKFFVPLNIQIRAGKSHYSFTVLCWLKGKTT